MTRAEDFLSKFAARVERVDVPGYPDPVFVRGMQAGEFIAVTAGEDRRAFSLRACKMSICDEAGVRIFGDDDDDLVKQIPVAVVNAASAVVMRLSGLGEEDEDDEGKGPSATSP